MNKDKSSKDTAAIIGKLELDLYSAHCYITALLDDNKRLKKELTLLHSKNLKRKAQNIISNQFCEKLKEENAHLRECNQNM